MVFENLGGKVDLHLTPVGFSVILPQHDQLQLNIHQVFRITCQLIFFLF